MHLLVAEEKRAFIRKAGSLGIPFLASSTMSRQEASAPHPMPALLFQGRLEMSPKFLHKLWDFWVKWKERSLR